MSVELYPQNMPAIALAHEIKTPASLAMAYVSLIRQTNTSAKVNEYCNNIQQALWDICDLVHELLINTKKQHTKCTINITDLLTEMLKEYQAAMPDISLAFNFDRTLNYYGNEQYVRLVFSNLLKNAIEAAGHKNGRITVYATEVDSYLHIVIHNNANTIRGGNRSHGSGMGLEICRWLVNELGGNMRVEIDEDGGCVAIVSMPCGV